MALTPVVPGLEPAFDVAVELAAPIEYGVTSAGTRRIISITGGEITGGLEARILPGGADWQRVRLDGTMEIDTRYSAQTEDGELLYLQASGIRTGPADVLAALGRGEAVDPSEYYFRTLVHIETSAPGLAHLQRGLYVASCVRESATVRYRAYRLT